MKIIVVLVFSLLLLNCSATYQYSKNPAAFEEILPEESKGRKAVLETISNDTLDIIVEKIKQDTLFYTSSNTGSDSSIQPFGIHFSGINKLSYHKPNIFGGFFAGSALVFASARLLDGSLTSEGLLLGGAVGATILRTKKSYIFPKVSGYQKSKTIRYLEQFNSGKNIKLFVGSDTLDVIYDKIDKDTVYFRLPKYYSQEKERYYGIHYSLIQKLSYEESTGYSGFLLGSVLGAIGGTALIKGANQTNPFYILTIGSGLLGGFFGAATITKEKIIYPSGREHTVEHIPDKREKEIISELNTANLEKRRNPLFFKFKPGIGLGFTNGLENHHVGSENYKFSGSFGFLLEYYLNKRSSLQVEISYLSKGGSWGDIETGSKISLGYITFSAAYSRNILPYMDLTAGAFAGYNTDASIDWYTSDFVFNEENEYPDYRLDDIINKFEYGLVGGIRFGKITSRTRVGLSWHFPLSDLFKNDHQLANIDFSNKKNAQFNVFMLSFEFMF